MLCRGDEDVLAAIREERSLPGMMSPMRACFCCQMFRA